LILEVIRGISLEEYLLAFGSWLEYLASPQEKLQLEK